MTLKTHGNIALCQKIAMHLETIEIEGKLGDRAADDLHLAVEELQRRVPKKPGEPDFEASYWAELARRTALERQCIAILKAHGIDPSELGLRGDNER